MVVTLGILSIFQLVFLPGLVVCQLAKLRGAGNIILVSLALSPIINYLFVFATTALGFYNQWVTLIFFGIELAFLIYLTYPILNKPIGQVLNPQAMAMFFKEYINKNNGKTGCFGIFIKIVLVIVFSLAVYCVLNYLSIYATQKTAVFTEWDAVVSWDRWAVDWYNNHFATMTWHYPQLIPANWSLTYQFMGDSRIKFFAKDFMGFIEIYIILTIFILGIIKRQAGYFIGVIFTAGLQSVFGSQGNGYVDSSVAFFALSSVACLLIAEKEDDQGKPAYIYIGAIIAAGTAVTKQAGIWVALAYPLLLFFNNNINENRKYVYRYIPGILVIYALIIFPWYGYTEYQILTGKDSSEFVSITSQATQDRSWVHQLDHSLGLIQVKLTSQFISGKLMVILLGILMLFACVDRFYRSLLGLIIIPFTLIWALFFSYDTRNLNLVVPIIGLTAGIGLQKMIERITLLDFWPLFKQFSFINRMKEINTFHLFIKKLMSIKVIYLIIPVLGIFLLPLKYPDSYMINKSIARQKEIGYSSINQQIYEYQSKYGFDGMILTDYQMIGYLPGLEKYYKWADSSNILKQIDESQVGYALLNSVWTSPEVFVYIRQNIAQGKMKIIFEQTPFLFVTTCRGPCNP